MKRFYFINTTLVLLFTASITFLYVTENKVQGITVVIIAAVILSIISIINYKKNYASK
ncbi:hypothetical protein [Kurthia zopfii]|uniref:hypothetical protein n=1 Tax=Kurthia zopfii TaxID=1650 RepID=UPI000F6C0A9D|nr:hypothetical protein [Kurthia zopfii]VEI06653.1 Uncharacterised protein [Kurthia zopfii]